MTPITPAPKPHEKSLVSQSKTRSARFHRGFTLVELMVVIVITVVIAALSIFAVRRAMTSARISKNMQHLRDLAQIFTTYSSEYGHYPPGWDATYGLGPADKNGQRLSGRGPDLVNAYLDSYELNERWLSPMVQAQLVSYTSGGQPTNYSGHPALCYNGSDRPDPLPSTVVSRPSETFLLLDGISKADTSNRNSQTSVRQWYSYQGVSDPSRANQLLPVKPSGGSESNGPDFRNSGKCHVVFCDGHVEAFAPGDFKVKHVALRF